MKIVGEQLHPILWAGRQWAVTTYGLECRDGTYAIKKDDLLEAGPDWPWHRHMAGKSWVDLDDFKSAHAKAVEFHGVAAA